VASPFSPYSVDSIIFGLELMLTIVYKNKGIEFETNVSSPNFVK
jgi:hypothetical protein